MWRRVLFLQCAVLGSNALVYSTSSPSAATASKWSPHSLGRLIAHCLGGLEVWKCLGFESERLLDAATSDNSTWQVNDYLSFEALENGNGSESRARSESGLAGKLLQLIQGRALRLQMPRQLSISNAIDDFGSELGLDQGTNAFIIDDKVDRIIAGLGSFVHATDIDTDKDKDKKKKKKKKKKKDKNKKKKKKKDKDKKKKKKDKNKKKSKNCSKKTGRKKKDKDKHMAMMGGMIMMATLAQMFLGKVILIAGSAFIMAKIALVISLLGSLKKGTTGHSGSSDHVIIAGGHSHESGWHRSMPTHGGHSSAQQIEQIEEPSHDMDHDQAYYAYEAEPLDRRQFAQLERPQTITKTTAHGFL